LRGERGIYAWLARDAGRTDGRSVRDSLLATGLIKRDWFQKSAGQPDLPAGLNAFTRPAFYFCKFKTG
jgi:hypothetical protein